MTTLTQEAAPDVARDKGDQPGKGRPRSPFGPIGTRATSKTYTPWLVIRYAAGDIGNRPLPSSAVFWESPDVWVVSSLGINRPVPGEANHVFARVTNYGLQQANGVVVKFWWANPSLAITESTAHLIGTGFCDVPSLRSVVVPCPRPWVPVEENGGHECLLAEAYVPAKDPLTAPMDPVADRHVGQKNEQLVNVQAGGQFRVGLTLVNASALAQAATVEVRPVLSERLPAIVAGRVAGADNALVAPLAAAAPTLRPPTQAGLSVALDEVPGERLVLPPSRLFARRLLEAPLPGQASGGQCDCDPPLLSHSADLAPWESAKVELRGVVPAGAQRGDTFVLRVAERLGPVVVGGYTVVVVVV